eukprot:Phypoly_transcript_13139.p1 GENE.Phypoly_transcript_13139~~Phypoly_transcript_13139.p1  ORF type:complete len:306 (+),score=17.87 Phypoly_transcript_13139:126-1043(+)
MADLLGPLLLKNGWKTASFNIQSNWRESLQDEKGVIYIDHKENVYANYGDQLFKNSMPLVNSTVWKAIHCQFFTIDILSDDIVILQKNNTIVRLSPLGKLRYTKQISKSQCLFNGIAVYGNLLYTNETTSLWVVDLALSNDCVILTKWVEKLHTHNCVVSGISKNGKKIFVWTDMLMVTLDTSGVICSDAIVSSHTKGLAIAESGFWTFGVNYSFQSVLTWHAFDGCESKMFPIARSYFAAKCSRKKAVMSYSGTLTKYERQALVLKKLFETSKTENSMWFLPTQRLIYLQDKNKQLYKYTLQVK